MQQQRIVLDTNVLVSVSIRLTSSPRRVLLKARAEGLLLASEETLAELREVLFRPKFDRYVEPELRESMLEDYVSQCRLISIPFAIVACRDPRDDKFLAVAVHGRADLIVTGDVDLLALHPFRGISILSPGAYLERDQR